MPRKSPGEGERARQLRAQEAARIIVDHGLRDYRIAKTKAAERVRQLLEKETAATSQQ